MQLLGQRIVNRSGSQVAAFLGQHSGDIAGAGGQHTVRGAYRYQQGRGFAVSVDAQKAANQAVNETEAQFDGGTFGVAGGQEVGGDGAQIPVAVAVAAFPVFPGAAPENAGEHQGRRVGAVVARRRAEPAAQVAIAQPRQGAVAGVEVINAGAQAVQVAADDIDFGRIQGAGGGGGAIMDCAIAQLAAADDGGRVIEQAGQPGEGEGRGGVDVAADGVQGGHSRAVFRRRVGQGDGPQARIGFVQGRLVFQVDVLQFGGVVEPAGDAVGGGGHRDGSFG